MGTFEMLECYRRLFFFCAFCIYFMSVCLCLSDGVDKVTKSKKVLSSKEIEVGSKDIRSSKLVKHMERDSDDYKKRKAKKKSQGYRLFHTKGKIKDCENKCQEDESYCGLELYNFDNKCHLDCENEKIELAGRKFEPVHGNQCNGAEFHDLDIEIRPELPKNDDKPKKVSGRSLGKSNKKAEKQILKIAEKDSDAIKSNGTLGTKLILHIDDGGKKAKARSMKATVHDAKRKERRKLQKIFASLSIG